MRLGIAIIAMVLVAVVTIPCLAGNNPNVKCAVHVRPHNAKAACDVGIDYISDIETTEPGFSVDAFAVFYNLTEYLGCEYGLTWPAWTYSAAFTSCSDLVVGTIVWPGDGAAHTWLTCQNTPADSICVGGFVWLYADDAGRICLIDHPEVIGFLSVLDCSDGLDIIPDDSLAAKAACAGVYGAVGDEVAVEPTTWGGIKQMFR